MATINNNSCWRHNKTRRLYRVLLVTNEAATRYGWPVTVVYQDPKGSIWARPLTEWSERYAPESNNASKPSVDICGHHAENKIRWWRHNKTNRLYRVLLVANEAATRDGWPVTMVYQDQKGNIWSRPLAEWTERYSPEPDNTSKLGPDSGGHYAS